MPLENWFNKAGESWSDYVTVEEIIIHDLTKNTVECRVMVQIQDLNGAQWYSERVIKMRLKKQ